MPSLLVGGKILKCNASVKQESCAKFQQHLQYSAKILEGKKLHLSPPDGIFSESCLLYMEIILTMESLCRNSRCYYLSNCMHNLVIALCLL